MSYDLTDNVIIPPEVLSLWSSESGRDLLNEVGHCFESYPGVLKLIGNLSGAAQPLNGEGQDVMINEGKRQLFLQILSVVAASQLTEEAAARLLKGED